jgi:hypothetical protein
MDILTPEEFRHTTLQRSPIDRIGITLVDEEPGFTGVYIRDENGGLWPARTVSHFPSEHHRSVCAAWLAGPGIHEDRRSIR